MQNIDEIHVTGTGQAQEQFIKFLSETAQYKNVVSSESTSNKMTDESLVIFIKKYFH
jgi:stalled ribosome rescue protein Dom34